MQHSESCLPWGQVGWPGDQEGLQGPAKVVIS